MLDELSNLTKCTNCDRKFTWELQGYRLSGRQRPRGYYMPLLWNKEWEHCDGGVAGIEEVGR